MGATNTKNASLGTRFSCSCGPKLEGMCRVGNEDAEHPKRAPMGTFWVFGVRGGARACWVGCVCVGRMGGWGGHCNNIAS